MRVYVVIVASLVHYAVEGVLHFEDKKNQTLTEINASVVWLTAKYDLAVLNGCSVFPGLLCRLAK